MITDQDDDEQENSNRTVGDLGWGVRRFPHPIVMITDQKDHDEMQNISGTGGDIGWWVRRRLPPPAFLLQSTSHPTPYYMLCPWPDVTEYSDYSNIQDIGNIPKSVCIPSCSA